MVSAQCFDPTVARRKRKVGKFRKNELLATALLEAREAEFRHSLARHAGTILVTPNMETRHCIL